MFAKLLPGHQESILCFTGVSLFPCSINYTRHSLRKNLSQESVTGHEMLIHFLPKPGKKCSPPPKKSGQLCFARIDLIPFPLFKKLFWCAFKKNISRTFACRCHHQRTKYYLSCHLTKPPCDFFVCELHCTSLSLSLSLLGVFRMELNRFLEWN